MAGLTPDAVRGFLLQAAESPNWTPAYAASTLAVDPKSIGGVLAALSMVGYIEPDPADAKLWRTTEAGNAVAGVSKAKPVARKTLERSLQQVLERIREVNVEKQYLYWVNKAVIFGPYLTGAEKVKNVDIALDLQPKIANEKKLQESVKADAEHAEKEEGKRFKSYADRRAWGRNKVLQHLKGRVRGLALSELNDTILSQPHEVIFQR
jgi:hypothetical protein